MQNEHAAVNEVARQIFVELVAKSAIIGMADPKTITASAESAYAAARAFVEVARKQKGNEVKFQAFVVD